MTTKNDARLSVRLPKKLRKEVDDYAKRHHVKVSALVVRLLSTLLRAEKDLKNPPDAEQI